MGDSQHGWGLLPVLDGFKLAGRKHAQLSVEQAPIELPGSLRGSRFSSARRLSAFKLPDSPGGPKLDSLTSGVVAYAADTAGTPPQLGNCEQAGRMGEFLAQLGVHLVAGPGVGVVAGHLR